MAPNTQPAFTSCPSCRKEWSFFEVTVKTCDSCGWPDRQAKKEPEKPQTEPDEAPEDYFKW